MRISLAPSGQFFALLVLIVVTVLSFLIEANFFANFFLLMGIIGCIYMTVLGVKNIHVKFFDISTWVQILADISRIITVGVWFTLSFFEYSGPPVIPYILCVLSVPAIIHVIVDTIPDD